MDDIAETERFEEMMQGLVVDGRWEEIYRISSALNREVSILIDSNDSIWIDWGDQSEVTLSPPYGAEIPFKLWVHTHPNMLAYWSFTDQNSLQIASNILDTAYVLGGNGLLSTSSNLSPSSESIRGLSWSKETVTPWIEIQEGAV
jgi:hypothetical protein